ncbi:MAG: hypothetical protein ACR2FG_12110 [Marmoricola sp.]
MSCGPDQRFPVKVFPWRRRGVLVPVHDRRSAALGVCMFTASKPQVLAVQRACFWGVRLLGARVLPGRKQSWTAPFTPESWSTLVQEWQSCVGAFDAMAIYQRRQAERDGLTLLLARAGAAVAVVKVRDDGAALQREQAALAAVAAVGPTTFRAPRPMGSGSPAGDLHWSAQTCVFDRPHRPVFDASDLLFDEVRDCLEQVSGAHRGIGLAHNDLTPWNLRRDHRGVVWLYDWEDWGRAPARADEVYFRATSSALTGDPMPGGLPRAAAEYWRERVATRETSTQPDLALSGRILAALDEALRITVEPGAVFDSRLE